MKFQLYHVVGFAIVAPLLLVVQSCDWKEAPINPPQAEEEFFSSSRTVSQEYLVGCFIEHSPMFNALLTADFDLDKSADHEAYLEELMTVGASRSEDFIQKVGELVETASDSEIGELKSFCGSRMSKNSTLIRSIEFEAVLAIRESSSNGDLP